MSQKIIATRTAGDDCQVVTVIGGHKGYRRTPCGGCPWKVENNGLFPAEAFVHSASTAYDMADNVFACHESGVQGAQTCAGFLQRGAENSMAVRVGYISGKYGQDVTDGGQELHANFRGMAIANGVPVEHASLSACRD